MAEFTKRFGPITNNLAGGESVLVTSYGKAHGRCIREGALHRRQKLDLGRYLQRETYNPDAGQQLIDAIVGNS